MAAPIAARARVDLGAGAVLVLEDHVGAAEPPPPPDVSALPGAELVAHGAALTTAGPVAWACARAPVALWVEGLERPLLEGASAVAKRHLALPSLAAEGVEAHPWGHVQAFAAPETRGRHLLGFDAGGAGVLCTLTGQGLEAAQLAGTTPAPPPTLASRGVAAALAHPTEALAGALAITVTAMAVLVALRPRPRARLSASVARRRRP